MKLDTDIHNYYEQLVFEQINEIELRKNKDSDYLADLTCLTLNQLPPRYIRYEVDMAFYLPNSERYQMQMNVTKAVQTSIDFLEGYNDKSNGGKLQPHLGT